METMGNLERDLTSMREYYRSGETKQASWRESQLKGLRRFLMEKEEDILKALMLDLGKHQVEAFRDEVVFGSLLYFFCYYITVEKNFVSLKFVIYYCLRSMFITF